MFENYCSNVVDREDETKKLAIEREKATSLKICILYAPSAVGKSSITQKFSIEKCLDAKSIIVRTSPINNGIASSWKYLEYIFYEIRNSFEETSYSFDFFMSDYLFKTQQHLIRALSGSQNETAVLIRYLSGQLDEIINGYEVFLQNKEQANIYMQQYIRFIFERTEIILVIDNLQNMDEETLSYLRRQLTRYKEKKHFIIFEYTQSDRTDTAFNRYADYFKTGGIAVNCISIPNTNGAFITNIIDQSIYDKPTAVDFNKNLIDFYVKQNTGNIRELMDYTRSYDWAVNNATNPTLYILKNLSDSAQIILYIIALYMGSISISVLKNICDKISTNIFKDGIPELEVNDLVRSDTNKYYFSHASIVDNIQLFPNNENTFISSISAIRNYLEESTIFHNMGPENLRVLLNIYKNIDAAHISVLFSKLEQNTISSLNINEAWEYLSAFIEATITDFRNYIPMYISILKLCFEFELYKHGYEQCLTKIEQQIDLAQKPIFLLFKMIYLSALDKHQENITLFNKYINSIKNESRLMLNMYLIVLASYRSLGDIEKCYEIHKILKNRKYKKFIEYGYRNRLVDAYMGKKAISYIKRSVSYFKKIGNYMQMGKSLISLTHVYGSMGKISKAEEIIDEASKCLKNQVIGKHMIFVNKAVLLELKGEFDSAYELLDAAETTAIVPFDKLAIIINKIVCNIERKQFNNIKLLEQLALQLLEIEPDKHIHSLLYYNLHVVYCKMNQNPKSQEYLQKAKETMEYCLPVKCRINNTPTSSTKYILTKPWHVCYLYYWTYDILYNETSSS